MPPYTTRSSGRSATSGSRLFWIIRYAASVSQERQDSSLPRGARMLRDGSWRGSGRVSDMEGSKAETMAPADARGADYRIARGTAGWTRKRTRPAVPGAGYNTWRGQRI